MAKQKGITMIEVLVTMLVIALGLLGQAALLTATLSNNNSAYMRSLATMLAYDVVECMRANRTAAINGSYSIALGSPASGGSVAGDDLVNWKNQLSAVLPSGDGSVTVDAAGNATIVIRWDERKDRDLNGAKDNNDLISLTTQTTL
jgi:type IV pilus assembly protein PilV